PVTGVEATPVAAEPIVFHKLDMADANGPPTIEDRRQMLEELANLHSVDPLAYVEKRKVAAKRLATTVAAIEQAVKQVRDARPKADEDQSQATRVVAIGLDENVKLWHAPNGMGYASVLVNEHWENYRIKSIGFEQWLRAEYGRKNQVKVGDRWVPQVPGSQAIKDGMMTLESCAKFNGDERQPALRVGGGDGEIWLDLGRPEWSAVRITPEGWQLMSGASVPFIRTGNTLPLPIPVKGGNVLELKSVLNIQDQDFVLVVGWL